MMKHKLYILGATLALLFSACFEIEEKVHFNKDGKSGKVEYGYDFNNMMEMLTSMMPDSVKETGAELDEKMKETLGEKEAKLKAIKGLSNVSIAKDGYKFVVKFDFSDINSLNAAYKEILKADSSKMTGPAWKWEKNTLVRYNSYAAKGSIPSLDEMGGDEEGAEMVKGMLESAKVRYIYTFDKPINSVSSPTFQLSPDKKSVNAELRLIDIIDEKNKGNYDLTLKLK